MAPATGKAPTVRWPRSVAAIMALVGGVDMPGWATIALVGLLTPIIAAVAIIRFQYWKEIADGVGRSVTHAQEYTADRCAVYYAPEGAKSMMALFAGKRMYRRIDLDASFQSLITKKRFHRFHDRNSGFS